MLSRHSRRDRTSTSEIIRLIYFYFSVCLYGQVVSANSNLKGKNLSCCLLTQYPSTYEDSNSAYNFSGIGIDYLMKLKDSLGFQCASITNFPGMSFTDFVDKMHNCSISPSFDSEVCQCELGTGGWMQNTDRYGKVQFIVPFVQDNYQIITQKSNSSRSSGKGVFFLTAFSYTVWIAILGLILCFSIIKMFDIKFDPIPKSSRALSKTGINRRTKKIRDSLRSVGTFIFINFFIHCLPGSY